MDATINGFSKLSKDEKIAWIAQNFFQNSAESKNLLKKYWLHDSNEQSILDGFSENAVSNFHFPFSVAPNFKINGRVYAIPMVTEESSVVAAASSGAKYWLNRGGIRTNILGTEKIGQIHLIWEGSLAILKDRVPHLQAKIFQGTDHLTENMQRRGGGIRNLEAIQIAKNSPYFQIRIHFETKDSMGANFINSVLEEASNIIENFFATDQVLSHLSQPEVLMSILSNYTPNCLVKAWVSCPLDDLGDFCGIPSYEFAERFRMAIDIARQDVYRAVTHNKGIFNGVDAVVMATGNDFRAVEACGHAFAAKSGQYRSLSTCEISNNQFNFELIIPLAIGVVGGLTKLHPLANLSLEMLGHPSSEELMQIIAAVGLMQNFAAIRSLVTTGIQQGHMKMHLSNILKMLHADDVEFKEAVLYFQEKKISVVLVRQFLEHIRNQRKQRVVKE